MFDTHCHFDFEVFDEDRDQVWERCRQAGLTRLMIPGITPEQWPRAQALVARYPGLCFSAGLHPWWLDSRAGQGWEASLAQALEHPGCVAVGECGLDKLIETPVSEQEAVLERQLAVAQQMRLPVILHCVRTHNELIRLLKRYPLERGGIIHAFSASPEIARTYWDMGFYLGVGGTVTYERAHKTRQALASMPLEALLLETDAPDMPLCARQGERNSPEYLPEVARVLADLRSEPVDRVIRQTTQNALRVFGL